MDLTTGLAAASQSLQILKQIKELDASIDAAVFKAKLLELQESAYEARAALHDAKEAVLTKDAEIAELKRKLDAATSGEMCPVCRGGRLKTERVVPHPSFGRQGLQEKHLSCENPECRHSEKRMHDPTGILKK